MVEVNTTEAVQAQVASRDDSSATATLAHHPGLDRRYRLAAGVYRPLQVVPYERTRDDPLYRPLWIYTQDPSVSRLDGAVAVVKIPYEPLQPGPVGSLIKVVDRNDTRHETYRPVDLEHRDVLLNQGRKPATGDPLFAQQMVYAVCSLIYATFRQALGRDPVWGFDGKSDQAQQSLRLCIRPHAQEMANAYYDKAGGELAFGYYSAAADSPGRHQAGGHVFTALSHDIIVHEMSHALLDGMRALFTQPTNADVLAFHEAFADLVALFQHFSYREVVETAIDRRRGQIDDTLLVDIARQFGQTVGGGEPALRSGIHPDDGLDEAGPARHRYDATLSCHALGSVLVSAVFEAFRLVYRRKIGALLRVAGISLGGKAPLPHELVMLLAKEVAQLAEQFLNICIRAVDYCPPVDITFGDYLRALITADYELVPDDQWGYREALVTAFRRRGIKVDYVPDLSEEALLWQAPERKLPPIPGLSFGDLRCSDDPSRARDQDELRRQACALGEFITQPQHLKYFGLADPGSGQLPGLDLPTVQSIRCVRRIGPDGQLALELVAEVTQQRLVDGIAFYGGATVIISPKGEVRYAIRKAITADHRIEQQAKYALRPSPPIEQLFKLIHAEHTGCSK
jgi:hypothetical protein